MARTSGRSRLTTAVVEIRISHNPVKYTVGEHHSEPDAAVHLLLDAWWNRGLSVWRMGVHGALQSLH